jgi:hypothetical protein
LRKNTAQAVNDWQPIAALETNPLLGHNKKAEFFYSTKQVDASLSKLVTGIC